MSALDGKSVRIATAAAFLTMLVRMILAGTPAGAVEAMQVRVRETSLDPGGAVRLVVSVSGAPRALTASDFVVTERGKVVPGVGVTPLDATRRPVAVALAFDISGSTAGAPLADAKAAAKAFVAGIPGGVRMSLVTFGPSAGVRVPFTTDRARVARAVETLTAAGGTALYDAVALSARVLTGSDAQRNIVVFTDGKDTASRATLAVAVSAARRAAAPVTTIGLQTSDLDPTSLRALASQTGGRSVSVGGSADLPSAFRGAARDIASQYVVAYSMPAVRGPADLEIAVTAVVDGARATDRVVALNPRAPSAAPASTSPHAPGRSLFPALATPEGLRVGIGAAFAAFLLLFGAVILRPRKSQAAAFLARGLRVYTRSATRKRSAGSETSAFARAAAGVLDRVPKPPRFEERLQARIDRAGWPFRASEFVAIQVGAALAGVVVGFGLFGHWWLALALGVTGPLVPKVLLTRRTVARQAAVLGQLPDTLQLLAGSLQAGYGFMQAIDTLVKESPAPTSTEFARVLAETRLGMPVEDALNSMADRLASEDFRWVVLAINIQRQVGGNLAVLLRTVAETLRERERVRRQIKVLAAEGKLSAYILGTMPFGIAAYIAMVNPEFLRTMTSEPMGRAMIGGALVMLGLGILWMRKIIRIEV